MEDLSLRPPDLGLEASAPGHVPAPTLFPIPVASLNNHFFQEFMRTFMKKTQAPAALASPAPDIKARDDTDRSLKAKKLELYYGNLTIECYYFCKQDKDHFEFARSVGHKRVPFAVVFSKNHLLNC